MVMSARNVDNQGPFASKAFSLHGVLGPVHMGRSYLGCRENISTGQIMLFCSYGEMFSRLSGKVSRCDVDFVKCKRKVFPLSGKVMFIWDKIISVTEISPVSKRDLGTRENFSSHMNAM